MVCPSMLFTTIHMANVKLTFTILTLKIKQCKSIASENITEAIQVLYSKEAKNGNSH